jgi:hypothetical protein
MRTLMLTAIVIANCASLFGTSNAQTTHPYWSGYVLCSVPTASYSPVCPPGGTPITSAQGTWVVPTVSEVDYGAGNVQESTGAWIAIGEK